MAQRDRDGARVEATKDSSNYPAIEQMLKEGRSNNYIKETLGLSDISARRAISYVRGLIDGEKRARGGEILDEGFPPVAARAVTIITDDTGLTPSRAIRIRGGRKTSLGTTARLGTILSSPESGDWKLENIDSVTLRDMAPADLLPKIIRVSPEMSRAWYDLLRMANPGWTLKAVSPGTDTPEDTGQKWLDLAIKVLDNRPGKTANTTWNQLLTGIAIRGMLFTEMVLSPKDARTFVDFVTPDPYGVRFRVVNDTETGGQGWELVQGTGRQAISLTEPTIKCVAFDPLPDTPYGTPPLAPGLFPCLFIITMFQDARRVVAQQGWPRLDIMVKVTELIETMPRNDQGDPKKVQAYVQAAIDQIAASYSNLEPDQAWVHTDTVEFKVPVGAIGNLEGVAPLFGVLERMAVRALKSMPLLMGMPEGVSEANANRQWEVHVAAIRAIQNIVESALSSLFTLYLEANGVNAQAVFKFVEMRAIEELRETQTFFQKLENANSAELSGYYTHDEASMYAVGHPAATTQIGIVGDTFADNPNSGPVAPGDTGDEKPIQGDDGAKRIEKITRALLDPAKAHGIAYALAILESRGYFDEEKSDAGRSRHEGDVRGSDGRSGDAGEALAVHEIRTDGNLVLPDGTEPLRDED